MTLQEINVDNYKSVRGITLHLRKCKDGSQAYGIIGENEAGKSSILRAIGAVDNLATLQITEKDFKDKSKPVKVEFIYSATKDDFNKIKDLIEEEDKTIAVDHFTEITVEFEFYLNNLDKTENWINIDSVGGENIYIDLEDFPKLDAYISEHRHKIVFWSFDQRYLISQEINLKDFFNAPDMTSVPLKNCFKLAGYPSDSLRDLIPILADSTEREVLRDSLGSAVTEHLKRVWKKHRVKITFDITQDTLNFHIKDESSNAKAKTIEQRSDGFRQFISFLLTVSAESVNSDLMNTILLLDEPETHLHPKAQEDLLHEFIDMTTRNNNIIIFATHSNYLIDKNHIERNIKVFKEGDETLTSDFEAGVATYASINYDVFGIASMDFHNELYDSLREQYSERNNICDLGINKFDEEYLKQILGLKKNYPNKNIPNKVTLPTYIRNCIHYPATKSKLFDELLPKSIEILKTAKKRELQDLKL